MNKEMTKREALERSIKHWEEDYPGGVDWANFRFEEGMRPDHNNCALCLKYNGSFNGQGCSDCPLDNAGKSCLEDDSVYERAIASVREGDVKKFMAARADMLSIMHDALAELDAEELPVKPPQEWLDARRMELTGECKAPVWGELHVFFNSYNQWWGVSELTAISKCWMLRKREPKWRPWKDATEVPDNLMIRGKHCADGTYFHPLVHGDGVTWLNVKTHLEEHLLYDELFRVYVQRDGSPCGAKEK